VKFLYLGKSFTGLSLVFGFLVWYFDGLMTTCAVLIFNLVSMLVVVV